jgi:cytidyltransferase-like protein
MIKRERIIITSGEFDPFTPNDLKFLKYCKSKGDWLIVGLHTDMFLEFCRGGHIYDYEDRKELVNRLRIADEIFAFSDGDGTVCNLLKLVKYCYPMSDLTYITDIDMHNMPEMKIRDITFETLK